MQLVLQGHDIQLCPTKLFANLDAEHGDCSDDQCLGASLASAGKPASVSLHMTLVMLLETACGSIRVHALVSKLLMRVNADHARESLLVSKFPDDAFYDIRLVTGRPRDLFGPLY